MRGGILIIADDYGLGRGHSQVMRDLLEEGAIHGVSVLVSSELHGEQVDKLLATKPRGNAAGSFQIGLHFNLTEQLPGIGPTKPVRQLLRQSIFAKLNTTEIVHEFEHQVSMFRQCFGREPDFIDGHQHCHCFPQISQCLALHLASRPASQIWVRSPAPSSLYDMLRAVRWGGGKSLIIGYLGMRLRRRLLRAGISTNADFSGFLRLNRPGTIRRDLTQTLKNCTGECVVMTHPGDASDARQLAQHAPRSRQIEAQVLSQRVQSLIAE